MVQLCREFMLMPSNPLFSNEINKKKRMTKDKINVVFEALAEMGFGVIETTRAANKLKINYFIKNKPNNLDITFVEKLNRIDINIQEYLNAFSESRYQDISNPATPLQSQFSSFNIITPNDTDSTNKTDVINNINNYTNYEQEDNLTNQIDDNTDQEEVVPKYNFATNKLKKKDITKNTPLLPRKSIRNKTKE